MDNTNYNSPNCHRNILLIQLCHWVIHHIKPLTRSFSIIIKDIVFILKRKFGQERDHWKDFKSPKFLMLIELMSFLPFHCSVNGVKLFQYWRLGFETFFFPLWWKFFWITLANVSCQDCLLVLYFLHLQTLISTIEFMDPSPRALLILEKF